MGCCFNASQPSSSDTAKPKINSKPISQCASPSEEITEGFDIASSTNETGKTCAASLALEKYLELQLPSNTPEPEKDTITETVQQTQFTQTTQTQTQTYERGRDAILNDITMEVINKNDDDESMGYDGEEREITVFELISLENQKLDQMMQNEQNEPVIEEKSQITREANTITSDNKDSEIVEKSIKNMTINGTASNDEDSSSEDPWAEDFSTDDDDDDEDDESSLESGQNYRTTIMVTPPVEHSHSSILDDNLDLNGSDLRLRYQIKMEVQETEEKFEKEKIKHSVYTFIHTNIPPCNTQICY